MRFSEDWLIEF